MEKTETTQQPKTKTPKRLTLLQQLFVSAYLGQARGNGAEACRIAGYKGSTTTLARQAVANLNVPMIAQQIDKQRASLAKRDDMTIEKWRSMVIDQWQNCCETDVETGKMRDPTNAKGYADIMAKHLGAFEADNRQKAVQLGVFVS